jgi:hypothetical protein
MGMLSEADDRLRDWLGELADDVPVVAGLPRDAAPGDGGEPALAVHLLGLEPAHRLAGEAHRPAPVVARACYVVTTTAGDDRAALELLDRVLTAALDAGTPPDIDLDLTPLPLEAWQALGARPRAALTVRVTARHAPPVPDVRLVREPLRVVDTDVRPLRGRVLGNGDLPLPGVEVVVAGTRAWTRTSASGHFSFAAVPAGPDPIRLAVRAKGRTFTADVDPTDDEPVVMHCDLLEA